VRLLRGQGAFEYILMLSGVLLVVITIIYMLQGTTTQANVTLAEQMKSAGVALDPSYYTPGCKPQFMPNSPADGAGSTTRPNISALITVKDAQLYSLNYNWNGANYSTYDQSLVLSMNFDDADLAGDSATKAVDGASGGNNGTIYGNTALLLHMDGNTDSVAYDESIYKNNGTCYGMGASCNWTAGTSGNGISFDGANDYVDFGSPASLQFGLGDISVELWTKVNPASLTSVILGKAGMEGRFWIVYDYPILDINSYFGTGKDYWLSSNVNINDSQWHHVAATFDRDGYEKVYVDGALKNQVGMSASSANPWNAAETLRLSPGTYHYFNGIVDEVGIYGRALSATEVAARYGAGRAKHANWEPEGKWQGAMAFDGANDFVNTPFSDTLTTWTLAAWIKDRGDKTSKYRAIFQTNTVDDDGLYIYPSTNTLGYWNAGGGTYAITPNAWTYVVAVRDGTTKICYYVNDAQPAGCSGNYAKNINKLQIAGASTSDPELFSGWIDEPRAWNRALSAGEISMQYRTSLNKYSPSAWFFQYRNENLATGTYNYTLYTSGGYRKDMASPTRTVKVCSTPLC